MTNDSAARTLLLLSGESFANVSNKLGFCGFYFMDFKVRDRMSELFFDLFISRLGGAPFGGFCRFKSQQVKMVI